MRAVLLSLLLAACAAGADPDIVTLDDVQQDPDPSVDEHVCDATARVQFESGDPWTPDDKEACFQGCETGDTHGYDQGRLACLHGDEPCPGCATEQPDPAYDVGYGHCFAESYEAGYLADGCDP